MAPNAFESELGAFKGRTGTTYKEIAQDLGITSGGLSKKRRGITPFRLDEAAKLAEMLGVSIDHIWEISPRAH